MRSIVGNINTFLLNRMIAETYRRVEQNQYVNYQLGPEKKFEIYCFNNDDTKLIIGYIGEYITDNDSKASPVVFYNRNNAIEVYNLLETLNNNVCNSFPELIESNQDEIQNIQYQIDLIKNKDNEEYKKELELYNQFVKTYYFMNKNHAYNVVLDNNSQLQARYNYLSVNQVKTLEKLKFVINKYEELKNNSKNRNTLMNKILKKLLKKKEKQV